MARVNLLSALHARARRSEPAAGRFSFFVLESGWRRSRSGRAAAAPSTGATGSPRRPPARTRRAMARVNLLSALHARARRSEPAAGRFSFFVLELGWRRSRSGRAAAAPSTGATGSPRRPPARTRRAMARVNLLSALHARARRSEPAAGRFSFFVLESGWRRSRSGRAAAAPSTGATGSPRRPPARTRRAMARVNLLSALHARARRSEPAAGRFSFFVLELGWRRSRSGRAAAAPSTGATGSPRRPPARTRRAMGLGRVLAPRFQPCTLSVGGTAPRAALA